MNNVSLVGRVVQTPELKVFGEGNCLTRFNLAINRYQAQAQKEEKMKEGKQTADFPQITVWGKAAENCCKYLLKGALISIVGKVSTSNYENAEGEMVYITDIVASKVTFLESFKSEHMKIEQIQTEV